MNREFNLLKNYIQYKDKGNLKVSKANIGWHLDHSLKVINSVCATLRISNANDYRKEFNGFRILTFALGFFPRGKAKSPKRVLPPSIIKKKDIENQLEEAIKNIASIKELQENQYFTHPIFKQLNKKQTVRFLKLHTNHHLKIVKDIFE